MSDFDLLPGEQLLWSGRPQRRQVFDRSDAYALPLSSVVVLAFAAVMYVMFMDAPVLVVLFSLPVLVAVGFLGVGRIRTRAIRSGSTYYAVTDRRIIEKWERPWVGARWRDIRRLGPPVLKIREGNEVGSIAFGEFPTGVEVVDAVTARFGAVQLRQFIVGEPVTLNPGYIRPFVLRDIADARRVHQLIIDTRTR